MQVFSPIPSKRLPGFAAVRGLPMQGDNIEETWAKTIDQYLNTTAEGGLDIANCIWPGYSVVFSENFPRLATMLKQRHIPAVDLGGFVPGGRQDYKLAGFSSLAKQSVAATAPSLAGLAHVPQPVLRRLEPQWRVADPTLKLF